MHKPDIRLDLRKTYFKLLIPLVVMLIIFYLLKILGALDNIQIGYLKLISILFFILAGIFGIAFPIFYRTLFISKLKDIRTITIEEFIRFEKRLIIISMITPYFIIMPIIFNFPNFYFGGIILFSLYAVYYFYPSKARIDFEKRIFRIKDEVS
jgi:hypothetical protein